MRTLKKYRDSLWRVPLIAVIAGAFYTPLYVQIVVRFGVTGPGVIDDRVSLLTRAGILLAAWVLGGVLLLRRRTRKEIFVSAAVVSGYGLMLFLLQMLTGSMTGPAAVLFVRLSVPLDWTGFFPALALYLQSHLGVSLPVIGWLRFLAPFCFVLFGRKDERPAAYA